MFKEIYEKRFNKDTKNLFEGYLILRRDLDYGVHSFSHETFVDISSKLAKRIGTENFMILNDAMILYNEKNRREEN